MFPSTRVRGMHYGTGRVATAYRVLPLIKMAGHKWPAIYFYLMRKKNPDFSLEMNFAFQLINPPTVALPCDDALDFLAPALDRQRTMPCPRQSNLSRHCARAACARSLLAAFISPNRGVYEFGGLHRWPALLRVESIPSLSSD
jgi:hypothetical protein